MAEEEDSKHRILTCNILLDLPEQKGDQSWEAKRRDACFHVIRAHSPDILCLQEVGLRQNAEFKAEFSGFDSFGFVDPASDRHPKRFKAIRNVIFYKPERYDMTSASAYWISPTPMLAATGFPGEKLPRHVSWVRLRDRTTGQEFRVLDTHFPLEAEQRGKAAGLIAAETTQYEPQFPQIMCGDFNAQEQTQEIQHLLKAGWRDSYAEAVAPEKRQNIRKIDFIFLRGAAKAVGAGLILDDYNGVRPSDHYFVWADVVI